MVSVYVVFYTDANSDQFCKSSHNCWKSKATDYNIGRIDSSSEYEYCDWIQGVHTVHKILTDHP